jgi:hypothetical protein
VRAIVRRLRRVEQKLAPRPTEQDRRQIEIAEQIQERLRRHREAEGKPYHELPPLFGPDYNGPRLSLAERILAYRERDPQLEKAAAAQKQTK